MKLTNAGMINSQESHFIMQKKNSFVENYFQVPINRGHVKIKNEETEEKGNIKLSI